MSTILDISPFIEDDIDRDSGFLMLRVSKLWEQSHEKVLKKRFNISGIQYVVLASIHWLVIHAHDGVVTQVMLSEHTKISSMTTSLTLRDLEKKGYVSRNVRQTDARSKCVSLTEKGIDLMHSAFKSIFATDEKFFNVLGKNRQYFDSYMLRLLKDNE